MTQSPTEFIPKVAALYARVSTRDQADHGFSLDSQREVCLAHAVALGYDVPDSYVFAEDYTGTSLRRPQLTQLRELIRNRQVQSVICYDMDRLSRKLAHQLLLTDECEQAGIELHIVTQPDRKATPEGQFFSHMLGVFAEYERAKILEKTHQGRETRARAGHAVYGRVTYGYTYIKDKPKGGHYDINEQEAAIVRRIFHLYVNDRLSQEAIAEKLTAEGIESPKHLYRRLPLRVWHQSTVKTILRSESYTGTMYDFKRRNYYVEDDHGRKVRQIPLAAKRMGSCAHPADHLTGPLGPCQGPPRTE